MSLDSPLLLLHPTRSWAFDAVQAGVSPDALDALDFAAAFEAMEALEDGAIANPDEDRQVGHYWLRAPELAPTVGQAAAIGDNVEAIRTFAASVRSGEIASEDGEPFTDVVHIGIGGSALGPQLLVDALADGQGLAVHFVDNTDPDGVARVLDGVGDRLRHALVVVVSKSGGTAETVNGMVLVQQALRGQGLGVASRMVAVTGRDSRLDQLAGQEGWLATFPLWDWVGGRTSVTASVGLLPGELAGIDMSSLLRGARDMDAWTRNAGWRDNPAALMAGVWHVTGQGRGERSLVALPYSDRLLLLSRYLQQLVMESLGKRLDLAGRVVHQGLAVYGNKGSTDQHAFVQQLRDGRDDVLVTFVQVLSDGVGSAAAVQGDATAGDFLQGFLLGTRRALSEASRPSVTVTVPRVDAYELGGLVALFERAVGLYASLVGINAYHQPGVEAGKKAAAAILELSAALRASLDDAPRTARELAAPLGADPVEVLYLMLRLAEAGGAARDGHGASATFRKVSR